MQVGSEVHDTQTARLIAPVAGKLQTIGPTRSRRAHRKGPRKNVRKTKPPMRRTNFAPQASSRNQTEFLPQTRRGAGLRPA